jgi:hypothetical protein
MMDELEKRMRMLATPPGGNYWWNGECFRRPYTPVNYDKWAMSYDELIACPDTSRIAYLRERYEHGHMATVGMRRAVA